MKMCHSCGLSFDGENVINCRFGSIYVILCILFELKENQFRRLNPITNECKNDAFIMRTENAKENLIKLKATLFRRNSSTRNEKTFEENLILDKLQSNNPWMYGHLKAFLETKRLL